MYITTVNQRCVRTIFLIWVRASMTSFCSFNTWSSSLTSGHWTSPELWVLISLCWHSNGSLRPELAASRLDCLKRHKNILRLTCTALTAVLPFSARQHIYYSALYAIARPFVRPSVTRVDQSKTVEVRIMQPSPHSSPVTLVFWRLTSPGNSKGNIGTGDAE